MYTEHLKTRQQQADRILAELSLDAMLIAAGEPLAYHADDQHAPFRTNAHFAHWLPLAGAGHLLEIRKGRRPRLLRVLPRDFWHWHEPAGGEADALWSPHFDVAIHAQAVAAWAAVGSGTRVAYVGDDPRRAIEHGIDAALVNPAPLLARLDWERATKSDWEIHCLDEAQAIAVRGHQAARESFAAGGSELDIHHAYVRAAGCIDEQLPYASIVALDTHAATLHYTPKGRQGDGRVLLIDSGATCNGYAADITRTWTRAGCEPLFEELRIALDAVQRSLCELVRPGLDFVDLHRAAQRRIGDLLHALGVLRVGGEAAVERSLVHAFFPHGLGHFLGLQVHDVGGRQAAPEGGTRPPPADCPALRTTRALEAGHVLTIEPGIYFIDMLLAPLRESARRDDVDWGLVERLRGCGGVRIEDDVLVTADGHRNLTRPAI